MMVTKSRSRSRFWRTWKLLESQDSFWEKHDEWGKLSLVRFFAYFSDSICLDEFWKLKNNHISCYSLIDVPLIFQSKLWHFKNKKRNRIILSCLLQLNRSNFLKIQNHNFFFLSTKFAMLFLLPAEKNFYIDITTHSVIHFRENWDNKFNKMEVIHCCVSISSVLLSCSKFPVSFRMK